MPVVLSLIVRSNPLADHFTCAVKTWFGGTANRVTGIPTADEGNNSYHAAYSAFPSLHSAPVPTCSTDPLLLPSNPTHATTAVLPFDGQFNLGCVQVPSTAPNGPSCAMIHVQFDATTPVGTSVRTDASAATPSADSPPTTITARESRAVPCLRQPRPSHQYRKSADHGTVSGSTPRDRRRRRREQ